MLFERFKFFLGLPNIYDRFLNAFESTPWHKYDEKTCWTGTTDSCFKYLLKKFPARENI